MRDRVRRFLAEYGVVGVVVYLAIHLAVFFGAWAAIEAGWRPRGVAAEVGAVVGAYLFTSLTKVPRFAVTVVVTPFVARAWERLTGRRVGRRPAPAGPGEPPAGGR
jgi:hypothetical protein